jgi:hypothetical protein
MLIGLAGVSQLKSQINAQFDQCGQYLETYNCQTAHGYQLDGVRTYYRPDNLPQSGTATLRNGPGTVTAPASGSVFTYTNDADSTIYTITAANVRNSGSSGSGSASGSGSNSQTTGSASRGTESQSSSAADAATTGDSENEGVRPIAAFAGLSVALLCITL